jgi:lauroyl/myristoyl acyltransferase
MNFKEQREVITITKGHLFDLLMHFSLATMPKAAKDVTMQEMNDFLEKWIKERTLK